MYMHIQQVSHSSEELSAPAKMLVLGMKGSTFDSETTQLVSKVSDTFVSVHMKNMICIHK